MKEFFKKLIASKKEEIENTRNLVKASESADEVRSLGEHLDKLKEELDELEKKLAELDKDEEKPADEEPTEDTPADEEEEARAFNPLASYSMNGGNKMEERKTIDALSTMEYRNAFKAFVQNGTRSDLLKRADAENVSADLGILLPNTIVNEIIKGVEKVYGQLYARVKKTNVKGGVQYPIGAFTASMVWDGTNGDDKEHGVSEKQKAGGITDYISFTYHIGEIRIAQSLLQSVVTVDAFEAEIVKALVDAYVKAMDEAILNGDGVKQPEGILVEAAKSGTSRIPAANIISFSADDMADWKVWQKKLFAKIPLSMRKLRPEFVMTAETWESNIMTLEDSNGRPVYRETYNPETGDEVCKLKGREVILVEENGIKSFDTATAGDYFGMYWVPEKAYAINSNMQFGYKKYFDENTNQYITKALVICDGKVLDGKYIYLLKKA